MEMQYGDSVWTHEIVMKHDHGGWLSGVIYLRNHGQNTLMMM